MRILFLGFALLLFFNSKSQTSRDSLRSMVGQMVMTGIQNFDKGQLRRDLLTDIKNGDIGGVIIFEKNLKKRRTRRRLGKLIWKLQKKAKTPLFISIDEEGGRVNRLKPKYGFHKTPTAKSLGLIDNLDSTMLYSKKTADLLNSVGINVNFAPVVDLEVNPENPVIAKFGRSFSPQSESVVKHAQVVIETHDLSKVATVLKHFPGHGSSTSDTHIGIADVSKTWKFEELSPYLELIKNGKVRAVMTAHVINEILDQEKLPATLSKSVVTEILRKTLKYDGVVFSDDMQMKAISEHFGISEAIKMSINAGVDVVLFANNGFDYDAITAKEIVDDVLKSLEKGEIDEVRITESYERVIALKTFLGLMDPNFKTDLKRRIKSHKKG